MKESQSTQSAGERSSSLEGRIDGGFNKVVNVVAIVGLIAAIGAKLKTAAEVSESNFEERNFNIPTVGQIYIGQTEACYEETLKVAERQAHNMRFLVRHYATSTSTKILGGRTITEKSLNLRIGVQNYLVTDIESKCNRETKQYCDAQGYSSSAYPDNNNASYLRFYNMGTRKALRYMLLNDGIGIWLEDGDLREPYAFWPGHDERAKIACSRNNRKDNQNENLYPGLPPPYKPFSRNDSKILKNKDYIIQQTEKFYEGMKEHGKNADEKKKQDEERRNQRDKQYADGV